MATLKELKIKSVQIAKRFELIIQATQTLKIVREVVTKNEILKKLKGLEELSQQDDPNAPEEAHHMADKALLEFIGDEDISQAFASICKWYA